jgi:hypothetical protein
MTTQAAPFSHANFESDLGYSYVFAAEEIREVLTDRMNSMALGVAPLVGDFAGSGTDTLRITHMGGVGWNLEMTALASETDTITPSTLTTGYSSVALGFYGAGHEETYKQQLLSREPKVLLDALKAKVPETFLSTWRSVYCTTGATISTAIGSASYYNSIDDLLDFVAAYRENPGSGRPKITANTVQGTKLLESARNEPAFQAAAAEFQKQQAMSDSMQSLPNFLGLGVDFALTNEVGQSGSAYQGFGHSLGGIGWAVCSTGALKTANPQGTILIPEFGIVIEEKTDGSGQTIRGYEARAAFGMALGDTSVFLLRRFIGKV